MFAREFDGRAFHSGEARHASDHRNTAVSFYPKVRILLDQYEVPYDLVDVGNVAAKDLDKFAGNPLQKIPVLIDGSTWLVDSDHIASYLVRKLDPGDRFGVDVTDVTRLNVRAILNGLMLDEVKLILGARTGRADRPVRIFP